VLSPLACYVCLLVPRVFAIHIINGSIPINFRRSKGATALSPILIRQHGDSFFFHDIVRLVRLYSQLHQSSSLRFSTSVHAL